MQGLESIVDDAVDLDPVAEQLLPAAKTTLARDADLGYAGLARRRFDAVDQGAELLLEVVGVDQQIRLHHDEQITIIAIRVERRAGEHAQGLDDKGEAEPLIA